MDFGELSVNQLLKELRAEVPLFVQSELRSFVARILEKGIGAWAETIPDSKIRDEVMAAKMPRKICPSTSGI